jgi:hypothetical protein
MVKRFLTVLGRYLPGSLVRGLAAANNYVLLGRWMHEHGFHFSELAPDREAVFESVTRTVKDKRVLYLEFGVYLGDSMRYWSRSLTNPESRLHGFDSFEGLPESGGPWGKGQFDTNGSVPDIADPRVRFYKGWFEQVLPTYTLPDHDVLVVTLDADLYSSTIYVLRHLRPYMRPGTFVYFDDLSAIEHEPRAIHDFLEESALRWRPVCAHAYLAHAFFECVP